MKELEDNMKEAIELYLEDNSNPCEVLSGEFELKFKIDAATFINYYSNIFTKLHWAVLQESMNASCGIMLPEFTNLAGSS